jgi:hypothetical protein
MAGAATTGSIRDVWLWGMLELRTVEELAEMLADASTASLDDAPAIREVAAVDEREYAEHLLNVCHAVAEELLRRVRIGELR